MAKENTKDNPTDNTSPSASGTSTSSTTVYDEIKKTQAEIDKRETELNNAKEAYNQATSDYNKYTAAAAAATAAGDESNAKQFEAMANEATEKVNAAAKDAAKIEKEQKELDTLKNKNIELQEKAAAEAKAKQAKGEELNANEKQAIADKEKRDADVKAAQERNQIIAAGSAAEAELQNNKALTDAEKAALQAKIDAKNKIENENDGNGANGATPDVIHKDSEFMQDPVTNFKIPQWGYGDFVTELDNFRKGVTSLTGEPGWFYFKIFFHFDEIYGLLGGILNKVDKNNKPLSPLANTAYNFLARRANAGWYQSSNLKARARMLDRFVKYLSYINTATPWFFDKVSGLDKAVAQLNDFSKEKSIEISCLEDAVDMRLTTLFHLYQYVCFDEVHQHEILPDNLRKFNMSIALYHVPIRFMNTNSVYDGGNDSYKTMIGGGLKFSNRMSYKLFTFRGCEFDLESLGQVIPGTVDNAKAFNLGKNTIKIKYDRCFTHIMNEWEQFMLGPEGIYYDVINNIGTFQDKFEHQHRMERLAKIWENSGASKSTKPKIIASIIGENFTKYADTDHKLGNIYNLDIKKLQQDTIIKRNSKVYLANLFDYNPVLFRGLVIRKNVDPSKQVRLTVLTGDKYGSFTTVDKYRNLGAGQGYRHLPNARNISKILSFGEERQEYYRLWYSASTLSGGAGTENFTSIYQLMVHGNMQLRNMYGTLYAYPDYHQSLRSIVDSYKNAWKNVTGFWKSMVNNVKGQMSQLTGMFKF